MDDPIGSPTRYAFPNLEWKGINEIKISVLLALLQQYIFGL